MIAPTIADLSEIEKIALGVLGAGLVPSSVAGDRSFRLDILTAVSFALDRDLPSDTLLDGNGNASAAFQSELSDVYYSLDERRILGVGGAPPEALLLPGAAGSVRHDHHQLINFDQYPIVFDRYLAGRCLDEILKQPQVYRFIMGKYAESSEIWQRVYKQYV